MPLHNVLLLIFYREVARDPEGETLSHELQALGYRRVERVRAGKAFIISVDAGDGDEAAKLVSEIARRTRLYNPAVHTVKVIPLD